MLVKPRPIRNSKQSKGFNHRHTFRRGTDTSNVKLYSLEIVDKDKEAEGKVVGSCEAGTKKIVYRKTSAPPQSPATGPGQR